jgi:adenylate cyclase
MHTDRRHNVSFAGYTLDLRRGCLRAGRTERPLRPKSFALLCHLVENAGRLVTKDELLKAIWPRLTVTDDSLARCVSDVRRALSDEAHRIIRTVPRRGYLFDATVSFATSDVQATAKVTAVTIPRARPTRPSVAVLPFASRGADPDQSYLASIITDGLVTSLLRSCDARVIAGASTELCRDRPPDPRAIARKLGVRYVLTGSEQHQGTRVRIAAQLIDGETGVYIWADQFDAHRTDIFRMQGAIVTRLSRALRIELIAAEATCIARSNTKTPDADDLALRGEAIFLRYGVIREEVEEAYRLCEQALEIDAENVRALAMLSEKFATRVTSIQSTDYDTDIQRADELISLALAIDPRSHHAHYAKARVLIAQKRPEEAMVEVGHSLSLDPTFTPAYLGLCQASLYLGRPRECIAHAERAIGCLNPLDPYVAIFHAHKAYGYFMLHDDLRAAAHLRQALANNPAFPTATAWLAAVLGLTEHRQQARTVLQRYISLRGTRTHTIAQWKSVAGASNPIYSAFRERLYQGLRTAGMVEA